MKIGMIFGCISLGLGIIFTAVAVILMVYSNRMEKVCKVPVEATVVEIVKDTSYDSNHHRNTYYHPVFEFEAGGEIVRVTYGVGTSPCKYKVGDQVKLKYDATNVHHILIEGDRTMQIVATVFKWVGIGLLAIGIVILIFTFLHGLKS